MASTVEQNPNSPPSGGMVTLPTHVIWTKDGGGVKERVFNSTSPKHSEELSAKPEPLLPTSDTVGSIDPAQRAFRLERSLRFLKSQHHKMLLHLQMEIEALKTRNKELQFQLVVGEPLKKDDHVPEKDIQDASEKNSAITSSTVDNVGTQTDDLVPGSSSERLKHLESELMNLRLALEDAESRNSSLNSLVSQLKRSHLTLRSTPNFTQRPYGAYGGGNNRRSNNGGGDSVPESFVKKIEEYEECIRHLRRENIDQKQELQHVRSCLDTYRGLSRAVQSPRNNVASYKLPVISVPPSTPRPNQARKTTELPYIHPHSSDGNLALRGGQLQHTPEPYHHQQHRRHYPNQNRRRQQRQHQQTDDQSFSQVASVEEDGRPAPVESRSASGTNEHFRGKHQSNRSRRHKQVL